MIDGFCRMPMYNLASKQINHAKLLSDSSPLVMGSNSILSYIYIHTPYTCARLRPTYQPLNISPKTTLFHKLQLLLFLLIMAMPTVAAATATTPTSVLIATRNLNCAQKWLNHSGQLLSFICFSSVPIFSPISFLHFLSLQLDKLSAVKPIDRKSVV